MKIETPDNSTPLDPDEAAQLIPSDISTQSQLNEVEQKNIEIINHKWQQAYEQSGEWIPLAALLNDKNYFPEGVPQSPYGLTYRDENNDHKADAFVSPIVKLIQLRENLSNQK